MKVSAVQDIMNRVKVADEESLLGSMGRGAVRGAGAGAAGGGILGLLAGSVPAAGLAFNRRGRIQPKKLKAALAMLLGSGAYGAAAGAAAGAPIGAVARPASKITVGKKDKADKPKRKRYESADEAREAARDAFPHLSGKDKQEEGEKQNASRKSAAEDEEELDDEEIRRRRERIIKVLAAVGGGAYGMGTGAIAGAMPRGSRKQKQVGAMMGSLLGAGVGAAGGYGLGALGNKLKRYARMDPFSLGSVETKSRKSPGVKRGEQRSMSKKAHAIVDLVHAALELE